MASEQTWCPTCNSSADLAWFSPSRNKLTTDSAMLYEHGHGDDWTRCTDPFHSPALGDGGLARAEGVTMWRWVHDGEPSAWRVGNGPTPADRYLMLALEPPEVEVCTFYADPTPSGEARALREAAQRVITDAADWSRDGELLGFVLTDAAEQSILDLRAALNPDPDRSGEANG